MDWMFVFLGRGAWDTLCGSAPLASPPHGWNPNPNPRATSPNPVCSPSGCSSRSGRDRTGVSRGLCRPGSLGQEALPDLGSRQGHPAPAVRDRQRPPLSSGSLFSAMVTGEVGGPRAPGRVGRQTSRSTGPELRRWVTAQVMRPDRCEWGRGDVGRGQVRVCGKAASRLGCLGPSVPAHPHRTLLPGGKLRAQRESGGAGAVLPRPPPPPPTLPGPREELTAPRPDPQPGP